MAEPIQFFIEPESMNNVDQQAYLDYRDRLAKMREKDISNPKKMAGMKKAVIENFGLEADEMEDILDEYNPKKIDPTDPKTWIKFDDGRVDIGRPLLVEDSVALAQETGRYRKQAQALGNKTLGLIEGEVAAYSSRVLGQAGIDAEKTFENQAYRDNYNRTMSSIYQDAINGIDPMDSLDNHLDKLGLPNEFGNHLFQQTESVDKMMRSGSFGANTHTGEAVPYPRVTQDVIDLFTDQPVYYPTKAVATTASAAEPVFELRGTLAAKATTSAEPAYQTTDDLIKDFTTKASSSQANEAGTILKDIFDKTDFANKQFDIPGSTRLVTGSDVLGKLSGIEMTDQIGAVAAYYPESGKMQVNQNVLKHLQPEQIATTFTHELFHTAADASGSLDSEKLTRATSARSAMTLEDAKYLGQQEGIADSFSKRTDARSWLYPGC